MALKVAPGFVDLIELANQRVVEVGWNVITDAVELSARLHTQAMDELLSAVCIEPPRVKEKVQIAAQTELQPLEGEFDRPKPVGQLYSYEAGYPVYWGAHAWGTGRESAVKMTVAEANALTLQGLTADANWMIRHILTAWFTHTQYTFADKEWGDLPILPLANGDSQEYVLQSGVTATDNHYLAQVNAIDNSNNPFPLIYEELGEHPENVGAPIVFIPANLKAAVEALAAFVPNRDPDIVPGSAVSTLGRELRVPFGDRLLGKVDGCWVVEWKRLPNNYLLAYPEEGEPFIGWRQDEAPELRGLRVEQYVDNGVQRVQALVRKSGFAVRRRTGALAMLIGAASYTPPAAYTAVIPQ